jgi:Protein of unknown function (DUF3106)
VAHFRFDRQGRAACARTLAIGLIVCLTSGTLPSRAADLPAPAPTVAPKPAADSGEKKSLLRLAQPLWSELSPARQQVLTPFATEWNALPAQQKRLWVALADRIPKMKPSEQEKAQQRIREWAMLTPDQRRLARQNFRLANTLPNDQRVAQWQQYQTMTPEQRAVLQVSGTTSNTAAKHAGSRTGLAKEAAQPLSESIKPVSVPGSTTPAATVPARN